MLHTLTGPSLPYASIPMEEMFTVTATSVTLWWLVEKIAYTVETYTIECGSTADNPNHIIGPVNGTMNISATNVLYSVEVNGLLPFSQYFCSVYSTNTFGTSESDIVSFTTLEDGIVDIVTNHINLSV